ncbi:MAG: hypothetical protein ABEN55_23135 [Bradymonadaceae bacterium]
MEHDTKLKLRVTAGGGAVAIIGIGSLLLVGHLSQMQAFDLLKTMLPTTRFLCSGIMTATATVLALMVTLISLSYSTEPSLRDLHYKRIQRIAMLDAIAFTGALLLLLFIMIPMEEAAVIPYAWYSFVYYGVVLVASTLGGMVVSVMMLLYTETKELIRVIGLEKRKESPLVDEEEVEDEEA